MANAYSKVDSTGSFSIIYPDSTWLPMLTLDERGSQITVADTSQGYLRAFSVLRINDKLNVEDWDNYINTIKTDFIIEDSGDYNFKEFNGKWNLVETRDEFSHKILYITLSHHEQPFFYTISITTENHSKYKQRICEMMSFISGFKSMD